MNIRLALLAAGTLLISSACVFHASHGTPPGGGMDRSHAHGVDCGHVLVKGKWALARPGKTKGKSGKGKSGV